MYANKPKMAKKWAKHTKNMKKLPKKKKKGYDFKKWERKLGVIY